MPKANCYSKRLLNPFTGVTQVIDLDDARAVSSDGINWSIQIRSDIYQMPWHDLAIQAAEPQYYRYGVWTTEGELARLPVHPTLYRDHVESLVSTLLTHLEILSRQIPFPFRDQYELWLLDEQNKMPVALLASEVNADDIKNRQRVTWYPCVPDEPGFQSTAFSEQQTRATAPLRANDLLISMLRNYTGANPVSVWVKRHDDGSGSVLYDHRGKSVMRDQQISNEHFPVLLLREQWPNAEHQQLVNDYLAWQAPILLTLPALDRARRKLLEQSAGQRPLLVHQQYRLYPVIVNQALINKILVEAVMREGLA